MLIALGGAYLETRGTSAAPLPTWDRIGTASAGWLDWLTAVAAYEPGEHDLAEATSWGSAWTPARPTPEGLHQGSIDDLTQP